MSEPVEAGPVEAGPVEAPAASTPVFRRRRESVIAAACLLLMCISGVVISQATSSSPSRSGATGPSASSGASPDRSILRANARQRELKALMQRRSAAIVHHHRKAFLATVDPHNKRFRRKEGQMFANLHRVHFASWSYDFDETNQIVPPHKRHRYHAPTWAPTGFKLHYRIAGFDRHPTDLPQYPTFVKRNGSWYLGSLTDFNRGATRSATDLWDYAPVHTIRRHGVLVLGAAGELGTMAVVASQMATAIPKVTGVWGRDWDRSVVVLVPSSQHEMARVTADRGDLDQIAALTSSEVVEIHGKPSPVGDRVTINPANWGKLGSLGSSIVLTHELTHVASRAKTGPQTPKWLSEGFADYVGFLNTDIPVSLIAEELATRVRSGHLAKTLPSNHEFRGSNKLLSDAYESGWLACRYLADHYGQRKLVHFYRAVGSSGDDQSVAVHDALHRLFHLTPKHFTSLWRGFVSEQLN